MPEDKKREPTVPSTAGHPSQRSLRSRAAHAGETGVGPSGMLVEPIYQGSVYAFADSEAANQAYTAGDPLYARDGLPNVRALERAVADLEGGEAAVAVSSGMAAITLALTTLLKAGDHVVAPACGYCDTSALLREVMGGFGVEVTFADYSSRDDVAAAAGPQTRIIFAETISNPGMELSNLPMLAAVARQANALLLVDNSFATPVFCRPLDHGADLVMHSAGKFLSGHSDVTAGVIVGASKLIARIRRSAYLTGPVLAPLDAWLTLRGMRTLVPRMMWATETASIVADFLAQHPAVKSVRYPGRPAADRVKMTRELLPSGAGSVLAFQPHGDASVASRVIAALKTIPYVPSIGGTTTIVSFPARVQEFSSDGTGITTPYRSSTIRLSVGLEEPSEILADLDQALVAATKRSRLPTTEIPAEQHVTASLLSPAQRG